MSAPPLPVADAALPIAPLPPTAASPAAAPSPAANRIVFVLSLVGLLVSSYLWLAHVRQMDIPCVGGRAAAAASSDCARLDNSPYAQFPVGSGIPVAAYGTLGYLLLAGLAFARTLGGGARRDRRLLSFIVFAAGAGALFSLRLTYLALFVVQPRATCPWCLTSLALISGTFAASAWELRRRKQQIAEPGAAAPAAATGTPPFRAL